MRRELAEFYPQEGQRAEVAWLSSNIGPSAVTAMTQAPSEPPYVLFCGSIEPRKNLNRLIEAIVKVNKTSQPLHLAIVTGGGWRSETTQNLINQHRALVHVHEAISDNDKARLYQSALCLALPSLQEGFGLPLVEAMKFGVPILTSRRGALPEIAADAALYVDPLNMASIAAGINDILLSTETRERLASAAAQRAEMFSWNRCAEQTLETIEEAFLVHR